MSAITVEVVVPVYNGASSIADCIESLLKQDYSHYSVTIVDNVSTDNTVEIVKGYPVQLLRCAERGPAAARNTGIRNSEADVIAFTDADCIAETNWLSELVKLYDTSDVGGVGGKILAYRHEHRSIVEQFSDELAPLVNFTSGKDEFLPHLYTANASYRRSILMQVDGFNVNLITGQDVDISWRTQLQTGIKLRYAPEAVIYHHHRETRSGLARQYRRYGYGEIILDTLYSHYPGYPRHLQYQLLRLASQIFALGRYLISIVVRRIRYTLGKATEYETAVPWLWFIVESNNVIGKLEALKVTRFMTSAQFISKTDRAALAKHLYGSSKE